MSVQNADFSLSAASINKVIKAYDNAIVEATAALAEYRRKVEEVLGEGWQGKAGEEFKNTIETYERGTLLFIEEIQKQRDAMRYVLQRFSSLEGQAQTVGSRARKMGI